MFIWNFGFGKENTLEADFANWDIEGNTSGDNSSSTKKKKSKTQQRLDNMNKYLKNTNKISQDTKNEALGKVVSEARSILDDGIEEAEDCLEVEGKTSEKTDCKNDVKKTYVKSTAAYRLVKYYAILAKRPKTCVEADMGITPYIEAKGITKIKERDKDNPKETGKSAESRLYLCTGADGKIKWRVHPENSKVLLRIADGTMKIGDTLSKITLDLDITKFPFKDNVTKARGLIGL